MAHDDCPIGYKQPPVHSRFQKGQSGNPRGRPKKVRDFLEDAGDILSAPVTGHTNGKEITLPAMQAMFRSLCREALKGHNAALRRVVDLMLTLEPEAQQVAEQNAKAGGEARRKFAMLAGIDPDAPRAKPSAPRPEFLEMEKRADAMAKEERKRLVRQAKDRQQMRY
ncbi:MAG: DUF5681 domain-containing protein [Alphaproteobacteria bacterium]